MGFLQSPVFIIFFVGRINPLYPIVPKIREAFKRIVEIIKSDND